MTIAPYRIATDTLTNWRIRAKTHGPIRPKTLTTQVLAGAVPAAQDFVEAHRMAAQALASKINPAATVEMYSEGGNSADWSVILP